MEDTPDRPKRGDTSLVAFIIAPIAVFGVAYMIDAILGTRGLIFPGTPARGIERFAVITVGFCLLELVAAALILVRARRPVALLSMSVYLIVVCVLALMFGTFRTT